MTRGRKPLPTAIHDANGSYKINPQRKNREEPIAPVGQPDVPPSVQASPDALEAWGRVTAMLDQMRVLTKADQFILEQYCLDYAQWKAMLQAVSTGCTYPTEHGYKLMPEALQLHNYANRMLKILTELGLTPSSRTKLRAAGPMEDDPFDEWLKGAGRG